MCQHPRCSPVCKRFLLFLLFFPILFSIRILEKRLQQQELSLPEWNLHLHLGSATSDQEEGCFPNLGKGTLSSGPCPQIAMNLVASISVICSEVLPLYQTPYIGKHLGRNWQNVLRGILETDRLWNKAWYYSNLWRYSLSFRVKHITGPSIAFPQRKLFSLFTKSLTSII